MNRKYYLDGKEISLDDLLYVLKTWLIYGGHLTWWNEMLIDMEDVEDEKI